MVEEVDFAGADIVHGSDEENRAGFDHAADARAGFEDVFHGAADILGGDDVGESGGIEAGGFRERGDVVDGAADAVGEGGEVGAASRFSGVEVLADELAGCGDGSALGVAFDDDDLGTGDLAGVFHAAEDLFRGHIACDADAEDIAQAEVEDEFGGGSGVNAAEHDGERVLSGRGDADLADEVAIEPFSGDEAVVAILEELENCLGGGLVLDVAGGDVDVLDFVCDGVAFLEADGADLDTAGWSLFIAEEADDFEDIGVDVVGGAGVEDDVAALFEAGEGSGEGGAVEEGDLIGEFESGHGSADVGFPDHVEAALEVAVEDEAGAYDEADDDACEEVREEDGDDGDEERDVLAAARAEHVGEEGGLCEFGSGDHEDGSEGGERDRVEESGQEDHARGEEESMDDGRAV